MFLSLTGVMKHWRTTMKNNDYDSSDILISLILWIACASGLTALIFYTINEFI